jgi:hypothetical protein
VNTRPADDASHDGQAATMGLLLRLRWITADLAALRASVRRLPRLAPARAPPCPVFLSLCVFRL